MTFEARYIDISQWTSSVNKQTHCSIAASEQYDGSTHKPHGYQLKQKFWLLRKSLNAWPTRWLLRGRENRSDKSRITQRRHADRVMPHDRCLLQSQSSVKHIHIHIHIGSEFRGAKLGKRYVPLTMIWTEYRYSNFFSSLLRHNHW